MNGREYSDGGRGDRVYVDDGGGGAESDGYVCAVTGTAVSVVGMVGDGGGGSGDVVGGGDIAEERGGE